MGESLALLERKRQKGVGIRLGGETVVVAPHNPKVIEFYADRLFKVGDKDGGLFGFDLERKNILMLRILRNT